jgi:hypothetical protein
MRTMPMSDDDFAALLLAALLAGASLAIWLWL